MRQSQVSLSLKTFQLPLCNQQSYSILFELAKRAFETDRIKDRKRKLERRVKHDGRSASGEGLEGCSRVRKSPTCSSQIFTPILPRLELNLEQCLDPSFYPPI